MGGRPRPLHFYQNTSFFQRPRTLPRGRGARAPGGDFRPPLGFPVRRLLIRYLVLPSPRLHTFIFKALRPWSVFFLNGAFPPFGRQQKGRIPGTRRCSQSPRPLKTFTCFIFSKSDSSAPPVSLLLPAGFALQEDNKRTNGKPWSTERAEAVRCGALTGRLPIRPFAAAPEGGEKSERRGGDVPAPTKERGHSSTWQLYTPVSWTKYDRMKPEQCV